MKSLKDVATLAGVSPSTVSRVINDTMFVTDETRQRVEKAIAEVDYRPNLLAQSLRLKVTRNIGLLVPEIANPSYNLVINHIEESAFKRGLNLLIFNTHNNHGREANAMDLMLRQRVNGIIFSRISDENHVINMSRLSNIPMVVIDRSLHDEKIPNVVLDNYMAGALAAEHLIACGCKKMATITGSFKIGLSRERYQGFLDTLEHHGLELEQRLVHEGEFNYESGVLGIEKFLKEGLEFDALWGQNDMIAAGAISTLFRNGIRVPQDVSVMGMDDVQFAHMYYPSISTIAQPYRQMCEKAVECIDRLTKGETVGQFHLSFPPKLVIRESTKQIK